MKEQNVILCGGLNVIVALTRPETLRLIIRPRHRLTIVCGCSRMQGICLIIVIYICISVVFRLLGVARFELGMLVLIVIMTIRRLRLKELLCLPLHHSTLWRGWG